MKTPHPMGDYASIRCDHGFFVTAGITPRTDGQLQYRGRAGIELKGQDIHDAAQLAASNLVKVVDNAVNAVIPMSLTVYIACDPSFTAHSEVADSCSAVIGEHYGSVPARSAVGVCSLPGGAPVELTMTGRFEPELLTGQ